MQLSPTELQPLALYNRNPQPLGFLLPGCAARREVAAAYICTQAFPLLSDCYISPVLSWESCVSPTQRRGQDPMEVSVQVRDTCDSGSQISNLQLALCTALTSLVISEKFMTNVTNEVTQRL